MIRKMLLSMAIASMASLVSFAALAQDVQPQRGAGAFAPRLMILGAEFQGQRNRPHALRVSWKFENLPPGAHIRRYEINVELKSKTAKGSIFQTPNPSLTAVPVGLLGIPAETRAELFKSLGELVADIRLKAIFVANGTERTVEVERRNLVPGRQ